MTKLYAAVGSEAQSASLQLDLGLIAIKLFGLLVLVVLGTEPLGKGDHVIAQVLAALRERIGLARQIYRVKLQLQSLIAELYRGSAISVLKPDYSQLAKKRV